MGLLERRKGKTLRERERERERKEERGEQRRYGKGCRGARRGKERGRRKKAEVEEGRGATYKEFMNTRLHLESPG